MLIEFPERLYIKFLYIRRGAPVKDIFAAISQIKLISLNIGSSEYREL